ncbi:MAG: DUF1156 domain-containing protein [Candidatus Bathyarchaeota archaeon]|nr:DUF1156 domain-containing protein [Candidatus Bathyarchaeota archaeon]
MKEKNLLEKGVPVKLLNIEAGKEKYAGSPTVKLHKYATRKPLITSRMVVAAGILGENDLNINEDFNILMGIDPKLKDRAYKNVPLSLIKKINKKYPEKPTILDPFAGAGTIPFEALRLGLNVVALDYNPVAHLIMKGTLEYPIKFSKTIYEDVEKYSTKIYSKLKNELSSYYPKHDGIDPRAYIHSWAAKCPTCGNITPLVNNWILDGKKNIAIEYIIKDSQINYNIINGKRPQEGNVYRGRGTCLICSSNISNDHIVKDISENEREVLLAVYLDNTKFELPSEEDFNAIMDAKKYLKEHIQELGKYIPNEYMSDDRRAVTTKKYLKYWYKLFNPRQLLVLATITKEINEIVKTIAIENKEYATAIGIYLSMILSRHLMLNSRSARWQNNSKAIGPTLSFRGITMIWEHPEVNPFIKTAGSLINNIRDVLRGLRFAIQSLNNTSFEIIKCPNIEIHNSSILSWQSNRKYEFIITDPPYYDDVPYPELFQYFQVWHNKILGNLLDIPSIPSTSEELSVNQNRNEKTFETRMLLAFNKLHSLLEDDGVLVMFYAHKSIDGWKFVLEALRKAGFKVTSTITLMTESEGSILARGKSSVFHSLVLTARKRIGDETANILDIEEEIRKKIEQRYPELVDVYGNDRLNLMVAASGIVIETITSYSKITSFTKNTADYAIEMGQKYLIETFARQTLNIDHVDAKTMLYTWFRHSPADEIQYTEFNQTLKAFGTDEETIDDIIIKEKNKVKLVDFSGRGALEVDGMEPLMATSVIDAVHMALRSYMRGGITETKRGIDNSPYGTEPIINTIEALANVSATKTGYGEGKICLQFIKDWNEYHGTPQPTHLKEHFRTKSKEQIKLE